MASTQTISYSPPAPVRVAAGLGLVADHGQVADVDAHAPEEAVVAAVVDRNGAVVEDHQAGDDRLLAVQLAGRPLADGLAGQAVVGGEGDVDHVRWIGGGVECDHVQPGVPGLLDRVVDVDRHRGDQDPVLACGDGVLDQVDLTLVVAFGLSGPDRQVDPQLVGLLPRTLLHGHEEGVGGVLGDQ